MSFAFDPDAKTPAEPKGAAIPPRKPKKQPEKIGLLAALFVVAFGAVALFVSVALLGFAFGFGWFVSESVTMEIHDQINPPNYCVDENGIVSGL